MPGKNIIITGELHTGKSTLVRSILESISISYLGVFSMPILQGARRVGFALRRVGESRIEVFAHENWQKGSKYDRYTVIEQPFERAALYLNECLGKHVELIVIDEIGAMENHVESFLRAVLQVLNSPKRSLMVVQKRAQAAWELLENRNDVIVFQVTEDNHIALQLSILELLEKESKSDSAVNAKVGRWR
mgnify:CR=1 FL=1